MRALEYSLAAAAIAEGVYLVLGALSVLPLSGQYALGVLLLAFGVVYLGLGDRRSALWGALVALLGLWLLTSVQPLLLLGAVLLIVGAFALASLARSR